MKNKKFGKILLCTTLALATPFALTACGNNANNTKEPDKTPEQETPKTEIQEPETNANAVTYGIDYNGAGVKATADYQTADAIKDDLTDIISGHQYEKNSVYWNAYHSGVNEMIANSHVRVNESKKYVFALGDEDDATTNYNNYVKLYNDSAVWNDMSKTGIDAYKTAKGIYYQFSADRDVLVCVEKTAKAENVTGNVTVYVFSFTGNQMKAAIDASLIDQTQNRVHDVVWPTTNAVTTGYADDNAVRTAFVNLWTEGIEDNDVKSAVATIINKYVKDIADNAETEEDETAYVYSERASQTVFTLTLDDIQAHEGEEEFTQQNLDLAGWVEKYYNDYSGLYTGDENIAWIAVKDLQGNDSPSDFYATIGDEDIFVNFERETGNGTITVRVFSFSKGGMVNAMQHIYAELSELAQ